MIAKSRLCCSQNSQPTIPAILELVAEEARLVALAVADELTGGVVEESLDES